MSVEYLKKSKPANERSQDDAKVRAVVEETLAQIEARGDAAVRELSEKFDGYSPKAFRLSQAEIEECKWLPVDGPIDVERAALTRRHLFPIAARRFAETRSAS